ncbi:hypothetical protein SSYRP_v1c08890 [Spiroplasma syrphidicola EA-1]|uniref:Transmembrane protein n=1 Tax=Spiroplasma syrphidicola EA-1 TaxID=1276229 RepID=R4U753_9MOLU|nr:hypothetical protein [Spiroplasma syrphidicola]AGM26478.1 hypothetical protein SSYRP_v1c08890 [Spiroplasma syrphidicola EA-1]
MKSKNLNAREIIERIFKSGQKPLWKSKRFISFVSTIILIGGTGITTGTILATRNHGQEIYYKFDDKYFSSQESVANYARSGANTRSLGYNTNNYLFDGQTFGTKEALNKYLNQKFPINKVKTIRNPGNYTINSSGELSRDVISASYEQPVTVYRGNDGSAYLNKNDALSTFQNYQKVYNIEGELRYNEYEARELYENSIKKKLENSDNSKTACYIQGTICQTEKEIKSWLRNGIKNGFEYQGQYFSDYNYSEYKTVIANIDEYTVNKYVKEVVNPDKNSYWISHDRASTGQGFFVGPKYVETSQKLTGAKFEEVSSYTPSLLLFAGLSGVVNDITTYLYEEKVEKYTDWNTNNLLHFLEWLNKNKILSLKNINKIKELFYTLNISNQLLSDSTIGLGDITDPTFTDFHKLLVAMKRMLTYQKVYASSVESDVKQLEQLFKEIIVEILNNNRETMTFLFENDDLENNLGADFLLNSTIGFEDIYNLFLNETAFFESNSDKQAVVNALQKIENAIDNVVGMINGVSGLADQIKENYKKKNTTDAKVQENRGEIKDKINGGLNDKASEISDKMHINNKNSQKIQPRAIGAFFKGFAAVWEISKALSLISLKTLEFKIDNEHSLYYMVPTFRIPVLGIDLKTPQPQTKITELSASALKYMLPSDLETKDQKLYEFNDHYYLSKENAKNDLIEAIYLHPERYVPNKKLMMSIMAQDIPYILPSQISDANICGTTSNDDDCITQADYDTKLSEEKNKFVKEMFDKYFVPNKKEFYLDGFGHYFETQQEALASLKENVAQSNFNVSYQYTTKTGKNILADSLTEIQDFVKNNEIIDSKAVINSDLITTSNYDSLSEYVGLNFDVYELSYFGDKKYFMSAMQAWNYVLNHVNYQTLNFDANAKTFAFGKHEFFSENDFMRWVELNTVQVSAKEANGKVVN